MPKELKCLFGIHHWMRFELHPTTTRIHGKLHYIRCNRCDHFKSSDDKDLADWSNWEYKQDVVKKSRLWMKAPTTTYKKEDNIIRQVIL